MSSYEDYVFHLWPVSKRNQKGHDNSSNKSNLLLQLLAGRWSGRAAVAQGRKSNARAASFRKMEKCGSVIISSACVSTSVNQQRWDVRCCVRDGFQAEARVCLSLRTPFTGVCAVCARRKGKKRSGWKIYLGSLTVYHQTGYNHHGNCPLWTKGELGRGGEESRHKRRSQPCWGCWSDVCSSPCLLQGRFRRNMWKKTLKYNISFWVLIWESALLITEW